MSCLLIYGVYCIVFFGNAVFAQAFEPPDCEHWSEYFNMDSPSGNGDYESLEALKSEKAFSVCAAPTAIDAKVIDGDGNLVDYREMRQVVTIDKTTGLHCVNADQNNGEQCRDYRVRYCCPAVIGVCHDETYWTQWFGDGDVTDEGDDATLGKFMATHESDLCNTPFAVEARLATDKTAYLAGKNVIQISPQNGLRCINEDQPTENEMSDFLREIQKWQIDEAVLLEFTRVLASWGFFPSSKVSCKDYEVRFCCPLTANRLLQLAGLHNTKEEEEEEEEEVEIDEEEVEIDEENFFKIAQEQFSFNDDVENEIDAC
ncbi:uncharacterized protein LOC100178927 [Ciona intestinalis]